MLTEKPKRKRRPQRQSIIRSMLVLMMIVPIFFVFRQPGTGTTLFSHGIAICVLTCSAVYLVHQFVMWLIAAYMGILDDDYT